VFGGKLQEPGRLLEDIDPQAILSVERGAKPFRWPVEFSTSVNVSKQGGLWDFELE
jgi:hypothetical protein